MTPHFLDGELFIRLDLDFSSLFASFLRDERDLGSQ
jgi:hypothetical protein